MTQKKKEAITAGFYVDRNSLVYFSRQNQALSTISLTTEVIQDLAIVSEPALERVVNNWLDQTKANPDSIIIVLSPAVFFSQQLSALPTKTDDPQLQSFMDLVPFEEVRTNVFPLQQGALVMAQNKALIEPLISVLEKLGFRVLSVIGSFALGMGNKDQFTKERAQMALDSIDHLASFNTLTPEELAKKTTPKEEFLSVKFDKKLILMIVAFVVLLSVLGILIWVQNR